MMEISTYNSRKIAILNAVAILLVLLLHSFYLEAANYPTALWVQQFTGATGLSGVAVPLFYFMSGLLFFKSVAGIKDCVKGIRKRVRSLLVPFVLWNIIFVGWYVVLHFIPGVSQFVNSDMLSHFSIARPLDSLEYLLVEPAGFHLWFLRDLMVYIFFTPLLWLLLKHYPWETLIVLYGIFGAVSRCGITYFALGGIIASCYSLGNFTGWLKRSIVSVCCLMFIVSAILATIPECNQVTGNPYWQQAVNTAGILAVWGLYDMLNTKESYGKLSEALLFVSKYSFFIYLFHEPSFNIIKKMGLKAVGISDVTLTTLYFVNPFLMVFFSLLVAYLLQNLMPKVYGVLAGGR